jgi:hypothetical protein
MKLSKTTQITDALELAGLECNGDWVAHRLVVQASKIMLKKTGKSPPD